MRSIGLLGLLFFYPIIHNTGNLIGSKKNNGGYMRYCRDCGLAIDNGFLCEFCLERHKQEYGKTGRRKKNNIKTVAASGWRGRPCGGGGTLTESKDFFGDDYIVTVSSNLSDRVPSIPDDEAAAFGNPSLIDAPMPDGDDDI